jgi:hypothetical protein
MKRDFHITTLVLYSAFTNYVADSTSNITLPTNGQFLNIYNDLNTVINSNPTAQMNISIFSDLSGQNLLFNKVATNINYTYPYDNILNGVTTTYPGRLSIIFNDGSLFQIADDNETSNWYSLNELPIKELT